MRPVVCAPRRLCAPSFVRPVVCAPRRLCAPSFVRPVVCAPRRLCAPSFVRLILITVSLMACLLLASPNARAGSYSGVTYSGGKMVFTSPGRQSPFNVPQNYTTTSTGGYGFAFTSTSGGSVTCSGQITSTFAWQPASANDPPPANVIVVESCTVKVFACNYSPPGTAPVPPSATCDTGLGVTQTLTQSVAGNGTSYPYMASGTAQCSYTRYQIKPGAAPFTLTCLPVAQAAGNNAAQASVSYSVSIYPVIVNPSGAIRDSGGNYSILVGQGCTGFITAGPATFSNFQWSIAGDTFKGFAMGNTAATTFSPSHPYGRVNYLQASDLTGPSPQWFWKNGGKSGTPETVSCSATATINGVTVGTVTGTATVNVWLPYFYFNPNARGVQLVGTSVPNVSLSGDITWDGAVGTPYLFFSYYLSYGIWQYTQLCDIAVVLKNPLPWYYSNTNGSVLDAEFNYSSKESPPSPWPADSTSSRSDPQSSGDAPDVGLRYYANNTYTGTWDTYMMYQPPGGTVSWVPLNKCEWTMTCVFDLVNGVYTPNPPGTLTVKSDTPSSEFPLWEDYFPDTNP